MAVWSWHGAKGEQAVTSEKSRVRYETAVGVRKYNPKDTRRDIT